MRGRGGARCSARGGCSRVRPSAAQIAPYLCALLLRFTGQQLHALQWVCVVIQCCAIAIVQYDACKGTGVLPLKAYYMIGMVRRASRRGASQDASATCNTAVPHCDTAMPQRYRRATCDTAATCTAARRRRSRRSRRSGISSSSRASRCRSTCKTRSCARVQLRRRHRDLIVTSSLHRPYIALTVP